jgi:hypothetical protein
MAEPIDLGPDPFAPVVPAEPPEGGWRRPCDFGDHRWSVQIEEGQATLICEDPCTPEGFDPNGRTPTCHCDWPSEDVSFAERIPVTVRFINDSTPSTVDGPAEYGYWLEIEPVVVPGDERSSSST